MLPPGHPSQPLLTPSAPSLEAVGDCAKERLLHTSSTAAQPGRLEAVWTPLCAFRTEQVSCNFY